jgi:RNA polymerase sigma-70 factor (ECF subfamily)
MESTDDEIVLRVQRGRRTEFVTLFDRYYTRLERFARHRMHSADAAQDIASETLLRVYRGIDRFRVGESSFAGFVFLVCRRLIINELSRAHHRDAALADVTNAGGDAGADSSAGGQPLESLLKTERAAIVRAALDGLAPADAEIILLAFERDLARKDIARILGKPSVTAVTSHLHRAMQNLRSALERQGYFSTAWKSKAESKGIET